MNDPLHEHKRPHFLFRQCKASSTPTQLCYSRFHVHVYSQSTPLLARYPDPDSYMTLFSRLLPSCIEYTSIDTSLLFSCFNLLFLPFSPALPARTLESNSNPSSRAYTFLMNSLFLLRVAHSTSGRPCSFPYVPLPCHLKPHGLFLRLSYTLHSVCHRFVSC